MKINPPKEKTLAGAILSFANGVAGVCEWLEAVEQGEEPMRAAKKAYRNASRRKRAVKKSESGGRLRPKRSQVEEDEENGVVIDVTPRVAKGPSR